jgi:hypothetical protein
MKAILLVLWLVGDHPPVSYQIEFSTLAACQSARVQLIDDTNRLVKGGSPHGGTLGVPGNSVIPLPPMQTFFQLSVICAER